MEICLKKKRSFGIIYTDDQKFVNDSSFSYSDIFVYQVPYYDRSRLRDPVYHHSHCSKMPVQPPDEFHKRM